MNRMTAWLEEFWPQHMTVCLGLFGLANLWIALGVPYFRVLATALYVAALVCTIMRALVHPEDFKGDFSNTMKLSSYEGCVCATYFFAQVIGVWYPTAGKWLWCAAFILNIPVIYQFVRLLLEGKRDWNKVYPMWYFFFLFCGIGAIAGPSVGMTSLCYVLSGMSLLLYPILSAFVLTRVFLKGPLPLAMLPSLAILEAAPSMTFVSLLQSHDDIPFWLATTLVCLGQGFFIYLLTNIRRFAALPFSPAHCAFTFPFAVGTTALLQYTRLYAPAQIAGILQYFVYAEVLFTTCVILGVLIRFLMRDFCIWRATERLSNKDNSLSTLCQANAEKAPCALCQG